MNLVPMRSTPTNFLTELDLPGALAFSSRRGCSDPSDPYDGLNACHYVGDNPDSVAKARRTVAEAVGLPPEALIIPRQTHSLNIAVITESGPYDLSFDDIDGLVTDRHDIALCVNTADCVPVLLCDPVARVCAAVHSGWRGTVGRIVARAVEAMGSLGAVPAHIHAAMGPAICAGCFEVGVEVADRFRQEFPFVPAIVIERDGSKPHVDLAEAIRATLIDAGLPTGNIAMPPACSRCNPDQYFSARRLGVNSGRTLSVVRLLPGGADHSDIY